jgi:hypothetical protein
MYVIMSGVRIEHKDVLIEREKTEYFKNCARRWMEVKNNSYMKLKQGTDAIAARERELLNRKRNFYRAKKRLYREKHLLVMLGREHIQENLVKCSYLNAFLPHGDRGAKSEGASVGLQQLMKLYSARILGLKAENAKLRMELDERGSALTMAGSGNIEQ